MQRGRPISSSPSRPAGLDVKRRAVGAPDRHPIGALTHFWYSFAFCAFCAHETGSREIEPAVAVHPSTWRLTSLSFVIWPSVVSLRRGPPFLDRVNGRRLGFRSR